MMAYMGTVTVILLNILIAQMSTTYTQAKKVARLEYDVDRILQLTRMERFPFLVSVQRKSLWESSIERHVLVCVIETMCDHESNWEGENGCEEVIDFFCTNFLSAEFAH